MALDEELNQFVNFKYLPLNHINPNNGSYICDGMACDSVKFESCLVNKYCWHKNPNSCNATNQLNVAHFMKCFEGPYANREATPDPSRRELCMRKSNLDYDLINDCANNYTQVNEIEYELNLTRAPLYKKLGPNPGLFPHIFVNENHLWNNSWTSLVRILCDEIQSNNNNNHENIPNICNSNSIKMSFSFINLNSILLNKTIITNHIQEFNKGLIEALNFLSSQSWLPINFKTSQPDGSPSYVNIKAIDSVEVTKIDENDDNHNGIYIEIVIKLLNAFYDNKNIINGIVGGSFPSFVAWSMENNGFQMVKEDNIFNQTLI